MNNRQNGTASGLNRSELSMSPWLSAMIARVHPVVGHGKPVIARKSDSGIRADDSSKQFHSRYTIANA